MFPTRLSNVILIGLGAVILFLAEDAEARRRDNGDTSYDSEAYSDTGLPRSIGSKVKKAASNPVTKAPLPFNPTPDPGFKIMIGRRMQEILKAHNETFDEFDNDFYDNYDNEFARGAMRYSNFEKKEKKFQLDQIKAVRTLTKDKTKAFKSLN